jgi:hypothetical protein
LQKKAFSAVIVVILVLAWRATAVAWGGNTHRFVNAKATYHLPTQMAAFIQDSAFFALHSVDADNRRNSSDTSMFAESPRHYIDIDDYPDFQNLTRSFDTLIMLYGWQRVKENGTNPWATVWCLDSLICQLARGDWQQAKLTASDLGHYVADGHQPLHATKNYDGQFTNNGGIHSRYESTMLSSTYYLSALFITADSVAYVGDKINYIFDYVLHANSLVDTIMQADNYAKLASGWSGSGSAPASYYAALWQKTRTMTLDQMQRGTRAVADLWYSAWVDAGLISPTNVEPSISFSELGFRLEQNFPNPFNPRTTISYDLPAVERVSLKIFSIDGGEVADLLEGRQEAGHHEVTFEASHLASGVYVYRLQAGAFVRARKLMLLR